jgi:hypothetical protein
MLTEEHKSKRMAASLENLDITKMKGNRSWKALLWEMKHRFTSSPQIQKETP